MAENRKDHRDNDDHKMSPQEAGRKGGEATARSHDSDFYREIGSEGGKASSGSFDNDRERASEAGRKGGQQRGRNQNDS